MDYETDDLLVRQVQGITVVRLKIANITGVAEVERIRAEVEGLLDKGEHKLVLDFKYVRYVGSSALGVLIALNHKARKLGATFVISHPEHIQELLRVSRTEKLFKLAADPKEAMKLF